MGAAQSIPVIGEVVTVSEAASKTIAAGTCAAVGQSKAAEKLISEAGKSFEHYAEVNAVVSNVRVAYNKIEGDDKKADELLQAQGKAWTEIAENKPVVGHIKGVVHYAQGDDDAGDRSMTNATRGTAVVGAAVASGGPAAALAIGSTAAGSCTYPAI